MHIFPENCKEIKMNEVVMDLQNISDCKTNGYVCVCWPTGVTNLLLACVVWLSVQHVGKTGLEMDGDFSLTYKITERNHSISLGSNTSGFVYSCVF